MEKVDDVSSGYMHILSRKNSTTSEDIDDEPASLHNALREKSQKPYALKDTNIVKQALKHGADEYSGTEICPVCAQIRKTIKEATHFCNNCDRKGRYLCQTCIKDHNTWHGKNHEIVSLSVDRETNSDWQQQQEQIQLEHGNPDYQYIDRWIQNTTPDDDYEYGEPNDQDMASFIATSRTSDLDYSWANTVTDASQISRMALPNASPKKTRYSEEATYENGFMFKLRCNDLAKNDSDALRSFPRHRIFLPDTSPTQTQNPDEDVCPLSFGDCSGQTFNGCDTAESVYDVVGVYKEIPNNVIYSPLNKKNKSCMIM